MRRSLATKISTILVGVLVLAIASNLVAIVSAYHAEAHLNRVVDENMASVKAAEELEIALLDQRGYVANYILDNGNTAWLKRLNERHNDFDDWLAAARRTVRSDRERQILDELEGVQRAYAAKRGEVVELYDAGHSEQAKDLLIHDVAGLYHRSFMLCEDFIDANQDLLDATSEHIRRQIGQVTVVVATAVVITIALGGVLLWQFFYGVIFPLRKMAADARVVTGDEQGRGVDTRGDEMRQLGHYMQLLMSDVAETRSDLAHSRTQLAHADKLAAVGKLAAGVAHEIRNPLTAMKMWLYSLRRSIAADDEAQKKVDIMADEIGRLENIVRNFLEFSRPAPLKISRFPIGVLLEKTIELLRHRLDERRIKVARDDAQSLPEALADAEQLKQVFLNLMNNAIEAMADGGEIRISTSCARRAGRDMLAVRLADSGSGMTEDVQARIFEPFFTTKPEGTGLGLCIAASAMARHEGALVLESSDLQGTQWAVWIPAAAAESPQHDRAGSCGADAAGVAVSDGK
jgi:signal transduction histidine kinase